MGITHGLPSSIGKHLLELFALDADGQMRWLYRPNVAFELVPCDAAATQFFSITDQPADAYSIGASR
jgi:hypothetical protein